MVPIKENYGFVDKGDSTTEFFFHLEYGMPAKLDAVVDKLLVEKLNVMDAKNILEKIKAMCEWP